MNTPARIFFDLNPAECHRMIGKVLWQTVSRRTRRPNTVRRWRSTQNCVNNHPGVPDLHVRVAVSHEALGWLNSQTGKLGEAEAEYRRGLAVLQKIAENDPTNPRYAYFLAESQSKLGEWLWRANKPAAGGGRVRPGAGDPAEARRRQSHGRLSSRPNLPRL